MSKKQLIASFLDWVVDAHVSRREAEQMIGAELIRKLIADGKVAENPWTERLERARGHEDFYP